MKAFVPNDYPTIGVEQEFHLIDPQTAELSSGVDQVIEHLSPEARESICYELYLSVCEQKSPVCHTADELQQHIAQGRRVLAQACSKAGVRLAAAGSHPFSNWRDQRVVPSDHYQWVTENCVYLAQRMLAFGLHVHVGMRSAPGAMYVMHELRRWAYPLMALSANSPFFEGHSTGLASTRTHIFSSMPRTAMPPYFADMNELEDFYNKLRAAGDITAPGDLWWAIRPQPPLGTVELRVFDLPTDVRRIAALAAVVQAAADIYQDRFDQGTSPTSINPAYVDQNRWKAMRYGLDSKIIEPQTGQILTIREQLERLFDMVEPRAKQLGSASHLEFAREMLRDGTESQWQMELYQQVGGDLAALELQIADKTLE